MSETTIPAPGPDRDRLLFGLLFPELVGREACRPRYSTNDHDALAVLEEMENQGYTWNIFSDGPKKKGCNIFGDSANEDIGPLLADVVAPTIADAISAAACIALREGV